jgi:hypothetical protein
LQECDRRLKFMAWCHVVLPLCMPFS